MIMHWPIFSLTHHLSSSISVGGAGIEPISQAIADKIESKYENENGEAREKAHVRSFHQDSAA
jgi:hypothetical protein